MFFCSLQSGKKFGGRNAFPQFTSTETACKEAVVQASKPMQSGKRQGQDQGQTPRKRVHPGGHGMQPLAGLPAKPVFGSEAYNETTTANHSVHQGYTPNQNQSHSQATQSPQAYQNGSMELFPGMVVDLPGDNVQQQQPPQMNDSASTANQPTPEALQLISALIGTLQSNQQQQQQHQQQPQQQRFTQQPQQQQQPYYNSQYPQSYNAHHTNPYGQHYNQGYQQPGYMPYQQQGGYNYNTQGQVPPQQQQQQQQQPQVAPASFPQDPNALLAMFSSFVQHQGNQAHLPQHNQLNTQNQHMKTQASSLPIPPKPMVNNPNSAGGKKKKANKKNKGKKDIAELDPAIPDNDQDDDEIDKDDDDLLDDDKTIAIQGTNIVFENEEDIQKWIEERKKNWPTNKRVEEKHKEIEKAKKIMENLNGTAGEKGGASSNVKVCNFFMKTGRCKNGQNCRYSHDPQDIENHKARNQSNATAAANLNTKGKATGFTTKALPNHKVKIMHGLPTQIPQRFVPLSNKGKSLHNLMIEGSQLTKENIEVVNLFEKLQKFGVISSDWDALKKRLKLDDESLNLK